MIVVEGVTKKFQDSVALDDLSLVVEAGESVALVGPNGAGKTTLLKCLVGLLVPVEGSITIDGLDRRRDHLAIRRITSWLADSPYIAPSFRPAQWLELVGDVYDLPADRVKERVDQLLSVFDLDEKRKALVECFSRGQYKKLAIATALLPDSRLLLMDEPFTGEVDPPGLEAFESLVDGLRQRGDTTLVFSTQLVDRAARLADRLVVIQAGRVVDQGSPEELTRRHGVASPEALVRELTGGGSEQAVRKLTRPRRDA